MGYELRAAECAQLGTHKELLEQDGVYRRFVSKQLVASKSGAGHGVAVVGAAIGGAAMLGPKQD